jgi:hypothetical protein
MYETNTLSEQGFGWIIGIGKIAIIDQQNLFNPAKSSFRQSPLR